MRLDKCPWCGAAAICTEPKRGRSGYAEWECGSWKHGDEPVQDVNCVVNVLEAENERLHSWDGLMSLVDEHYPSDVVDGSSGDPGPRLIVLLREIDRLRGLLSN